MTTIIIVLLILATGLAVLGARLPSEAVRGVLERLLLVVQGIADLGRRGSETVLERAYAGLQSVFRSVGLTGEHFGQRLFGTIFVTGSGLLGLLVGALSLAGAFAGLFGSAGHWAEGLPFSELLALELTVGALLVGTLLLDLLGVTRWSIYGRESFGPRVRNLLAGLCLFLACGSLYLFYLAGALRAEALFVDTPQHGVSHASEFIVRAAPDRSTPPTTGEPATPLAPEIATKAKLLLVGIPLLGMISSLLAGPVLISGLGLAIAAGVFLLIGAAFGSLWAVATLIIRLTDLGYNLLLAVAAVFSQPPGPNPPRPSTDGGPHLPHDPLSGTAPAGQPMSDQAPPGESASTASGVESPAPPTEPEATGQSRGPDPQTNPLDDDELPPAQDPLWNPLNIHPPNH